MNKKFFILTVCLTSFFLFFSQTQLAQAEIGKKINKAIHKLNKLSPNTDCEDCNLSSSGQNLEESAEQIKATNAIKSCVENICPNPEFSSAATIEKIFKQSMVLHPNLDREFNNLFKGLHQQDLLVKIKKTQLLLDWIKTKPTVKDPAVIRFYNLTKSIKLFSKFKFKDEGQNLVVDVENTKKEFPNLTDAQMDLQIEIGKHALKAFMQPVFQETDPERIKFIYPDNQLKAHVQTLIKKYEVTQNKIQNNPDLAFVRFIPSLAKSKVPTILQDLLKGNDFTPQAIADVNQYFTTLQVLDEATTDEAFKKILDTPQSTVQEDIDNNQIESYLQGLLKKSYEQLNADPNPKEFESCLVAVNMGQEFLPSNDELLQYRAQASQIKPNYFKKIKPLLSEHSFGILQKESANWKLLLPQSKEYHLSKIRSSLTDELNSLKEDVNRWSAMPQSPIKEIAYLAQIPSVKNWDEKNETYTELCNKTIPNIFPDASSYNSGKVLIGPMAVKFPQEGAGIVEHELSHLVYHTLLEKEISKETYNWFQKSRACILDNHTEMPAEVFKQQKANLLTQPTTYESEDFADLLAAKAVYNKQDSKNFSCLFARKIDKEQYAPMNLSKPDTQEPHSSDFFRLLHIEFLKNGKVPDECLSAVKNRGQILNFKDCSQK
jgi:hypothetical protein